MSLAMVRAPRNSIACEVTEPSLEQRVLWCLREAVRRCYPKQGLAADDLGLDRGHFSNMLNGVEPFDLRRLGRAPDVAREFSALFAKACGHQLASPSSAAQRRRLQMMQIQLLEVTRQALEAADEDDPGAYPFIST